MSNWYLIVLVGLAVAGILLLRYRNTEATKRQDERREHSRAGSAHIQDREDARLANMSAEDRDWEKATLRRNQAHEARRATIVE
jgi:hypothetical protein